MIMQDYEIDDGNVCPKCGGEIHYRDCDNCEDGVIDDYQDDPINYIEGESCHTCSECKGTGIVIWCSKCGKDLTLYKFPED